MRLDVIYIYIYVLIITINKSAYIIKRKKVFILKIMHYIRDRPKGKNPSKVIKISPTEK